MEFVVQGGVVDEVCGRGWSGAGFVVEGGVGRGIVVEGGVGRGVW